MSEARFTKGPWIEWNGGECPVDPDVEVLVELRDGDRLAGRAGEFVPADRPSTPDNNNWLHDGTDLDIIAYRIIQP